MQHPHPRNPVVLLPVLLLALLLAAGCEEDRRVVELAREAADRQAEQNRQIARQSEQVATATRELIEADAHSRREMVALQRALQGEQAEVGRQRDALEAERRQLALARERESLLLPVLQGAGPLLVVIAALVFCSLLLVGLRRRDTEPDLLGELLVEEMVTEHPLLLPRPLLPPSATLALSQAEEPSPSEAGHRPTD